MAVVYGYTLRDSHNNLEKEPNIFYWREEKTKAWIEIG